ncbi:MAG: glycosyltransferase family 2 protein [Lachnospiraceae bacterium]|nr:glycosyltransferase family 2 protein [Lachnospiraceae bacterium]
MLFTIFTPTYNRKDELHNVYQSIVKQGSTDLEWVIMDDGSNDGTKEIVEDWMQEDKIRIKYYSQPNQGRFAAYNNAIQYFDGDLVLLLDSDNVLLDGALQNLSEAWGEYDTSTVSGIISYMVDADGKIYGTGFPEGIETERIYTLYDKYGISGDKTLAFRRDLVVKYRYPTFENEKFGGDAYVFNKMNDELPMLLLRKKIIGHGVGEDSITNNLLNYHLKSPNGMREHYRDTLEHEKYNKKNMIKHAIGYVAYSIMTGRGIGRTIASSPKKVLTTLMYPAGVLFYLRCNRLKESME